MGLYTMIAENLAAPFRTIVLGVEVTVEDIDLTDRNTIVARCARGGFGRPSPCWTFRYRRHHPMARSGSRRAGTGQVDMDKPSEQAVEAALAARPRRRLRLLGLTVQERLGQPTCLTATGHATAHTALRARALRPRNHPIG
jgi:hypothetical protein